MDANDRPRPRVIHRRTTRHAAERSAKVDLALRSIVEKETISVDDTDVDEELERMAEQFQTSPQDLRQQIEDQGDGLGPIQAEISKRKASGMAGQRSQID